MYSQAPVLARALKTNPDPIGHTYPLRVKSPTLKTQLIKQDTGQLMNLHIKTTEIDLYTFAHWISYEG